MFSSPRAQIYPSSDIESGGEGLDKSKYWVDGKDYVAFINSETSMMFNIATCAFLFASFLSGMISIYGGVLYKASVYSRVLVVLVYCHYIVTLGRKKNNINCSSLFTTRQLGSFVVVSYSIVFGFSIYSSTFSIGCEAGDCVSDMVMAHALPPRSFMYMIAVCILPVIVRNCRRSAMCASVIVEFGFLIATCARQNVTCPLYAAVVVACAFQIIMMYDHSSYVWRTFVTLAKLEQSLKSKLEVESSQVVLEQTNAQARRMIANIAHDMKSPLHAFINELDIVLASNETDLSESVVTSIHLLQNLCTFMTMTINRAIDYSKLLTAGMILVPRLERINVANLLDSVLKCVAPFSEEVAIKVDCLLPANTTVLTDKQWLVDNLLCLVSNAQKFTCVGEVVIRCSLTVDLQPAVSTPRNVFRPFFMKKNSSSMSDNTLTDDGTTSHRQRNPEVPREVFLFEVEDMGIGVPACDADSVFLPATNSARHTGGTGAGLFVLGKRVETLGGSFGVGDRSDGERGSRFWFTLPRKFYDSSSNMHSTTTHNEVARLVQTPEEEAAEVRSRVQLMRSMSSERASSTVSEQHSSVLLVEDSPLIQKAIRRTFRVRGMQLDVANHGQECLDKVKTQRYDLILMDIQMPVMDGLEATRQIRILEQEINRSRPATPDRPLSPAAAATATANAVTENRHALSAQSSMASMSVVRMHETSAFSRASLSHLQLHRHVIIGVSANSDSASEAAALAAGMDAFLPKPFTIEALQDVCLEVGYALCTDVSTNVRAFDQTGLS